MLRLFSGNKRAISSIEKNIKKINKIQGDIKKIPTEEFIQLSLNLKKEVMNKKEKEELLIYKAVAMVKELTYRVYGLELFDTQIIAGLSLNNNVIAEMKTGEGKTFAAMITSYISFLKNEKLYIATANEYLAKRDSEMTSKVLDLLSVKTSCLDPKEQNRITEYKADIIYATTVFFAFDYLRDNLALDKNHIMQVDRHSILIDEADLTLIDQARTPLNITGHKGKKDIELYVLFKDNIENFLNKEEEKNIFEIDPETKNITLMEEGYNILEKFLIDFNFITKKEHMYISENLKYLHILNNTLKARLVYKKDNDYLIQNGEAVIIDTKTGRVSEGRRWGNGLHQAIEAKEGLKIQQESNTTASVTIQNYLKKFKKVSGMTGTAKTEEMELKNIYGLKVIVIPTNKKFIRKDERDIVFMKKTAKINAIVEKIKEEHSKGRPILIGTISLESSMEIADALYKEGISYSLLNAKNHEKESEIISNAGKKNAITISTNMAGRGTDIMLGGNREDMIEDLVENGMSREEAFNTWSNENKLVNELGGLFVIGVERNISRRIDNQLIGRSGRQGDNGTTQFYLSLEDDIVKSYGFQKISKIWKAMKLKEDEPVQNITIDMNIAAIQKRIEGANQEARKMILSFDDINEEQRSIIYELRDKILYSEGNIDGFILKSTENKLEKMIYKFANDSISVEQWDLIGMENYFNKILGKEIDIDKWFKSNVKFSIDDIIKKVKTEFSNILFEKSDILKENYEQKQKETILNVIDEQWSLQLSSLDELKNRVFFRSYAQEKPLEEYQKEIFKEFNEKLSNMEEDYILSISHLQTKSNYEIFISNFRFGLSQIPNIGM